MYDATPPAESSADPAPQTARQRWLAVLARADRAALEAALSDTDLTGEAVIRAPEIGTVMLEGRAGGTGRRFNLGEATVTRCVVRLGGRLGFAYALGRDKAKAHLAARLDALLQDPAHRADLLARVIAPLEAAQTAARDLAARKAAATKVDFFTLVRGDG
jgi:alpha-D-ribose 1-methylphosphonate 5-triphosphate synthase subunit PhnG